MGEERTMKKNAVKPLLDLDLPRVKPRSFVEWKTLRRWGQLPGSELGVPGYLLRVAREEAGLTQTKLASRLDVTQQAVAQAERWLSNPTIAFMASWMRACGRELDLGYRKTRTQNVERRT
jgi:DNA-binding XRE family transcriptional regulator